MTRAFAIRFLALAGLGLAACAKEDTTERSDRPAEVLGQDGAGTGLESFDIRQQGRRLVVRLYDRGAGQRVITVAARSYRGIDRSDLRLAYEAANEAGRRVSCGGGQGLRVLTDGALFQEAGRRSAFTLGEAAWVFQGRCG